MRLGRHPKNTTRVVFDMEGVESYSVFTLYNPFRMVIDFKAGAPAVCRRRGRPALHRSRHPWQLPAVPIGTSLPGPTVSAPVAAPKVPRDGADASLKPLPSRALVAPALIAAGAFRRRMRTGSSRCLASSAWACRAS